MSEVKLPSEGSLKHAARLSITDDKPILLDYWADSYGESSVLIGVKENDEKLLCVLPKNIRALLW